MNKADINLISSITGKTNFQQATVAELESLIAEKPYFPIFQLLLTQKMKQESHPLFHQQLQKTAIYFPNTHWLHYQLKQLDHIEQKNPIAISDAQMEANATISENIEAGSDAAIITEVNDIQEEPAEYRPLATEMAHAEPEFIVKKNILESIDETEDTSEELPALDEDEAVHQQEAFSFPTNMKLAEMLQEQATEFKKPVTSEAQISEPYHTIDYFASQGIKVDDQATDQLDTKVRKFTDWLKKMKRIAPEPTDLGTDSETEHMVQHIAASSNEVKEIVTEAMAQVLIKQDKTDKAILLYEKLSFLNPDKSAYFASKIKELKGI